MRIELWSVNTFFADFGLRAPVCLACNQGDGLFAMF